MNKRTLIVVLPALLTLISLAQPSAANASDEWVVGKTWPQAERVSYDRIAHDSWDSLLKKYVDAQGNVDYSGWKANAQDMAALATYLSSLGKVDFKQPAARPAQLAFWINAYNAVTVRGILREYPTTSIRNHTAKLFGYNIWKDLKLRVADGTYSLDAIEHEILRKLSEPRIHFAIVCASIGCPKLRGEAYTGNELDAQLTDNARDFFAQPRHFRLDRDGTIHLSSILDWFGEDFGDSTKKQLAAISPYLSPEAATFVKSQDSPSVEYLEYDWNLNDQNPAK